jgi:hypothetical protein
MKSSEVYTAEVNILAGAESEPEDECDTPILQDNGKDRCLDEVYVKVVSDIYIVWTHRLNCVDIHYVSFERDCITKQEVLHLCGALYRVWEHRFNFFDIREVGLDMCSGH